MNIMNIYNSRTAAPDTLRFNNNYGWAYMQSIKATNTKTASQIDRELFYPVSNRFVETIELFSEELFSEGLE